MISGMKITVAQNIRLSVRKLETLSHTVRLALGWVDDGITKGNIAAPAVPITPTMASAEATNALSVRRASTRAAAASAPTMPSAGSAHNIGCLP